MISITLQVSKNRRYLQWSNGVPFYVNACTAWTLTRDYTPEEVIEYLNRTISQKFNTIQISAVFHEVYKGQDIIGPAFYDEDLLRPKEAYWEKVDFVIKQATKRGLVVMVNPIWKRQHVVTIKANGVDKCRIYGKWFANRYKHNPRVIYFVGGDSEPQPVKAELAAMAEGIQDVYGGKALIAVHSNSGTSSLDVYPEKPKWLTLNWTYAYSPAYNNNRYPYEMNLDNYKKYPEIPFQLGEGYYDFGEAKKYTSGNCVTGRWANRYGIRRQAWWASFLTGSTGQAYGVEGIWYHNRDTETWQKALEYESRKDIGRMMLLIEKLKWWKMQPDINHQLLVDGYGTYLSDDYAVCAVSANKKFAVIYSPVKHDLIIDMSHLKTTNVSWYDPTSSVSIKLNVENLKRKGENYIFTSPDRNSSGDEDWVLVIGK